MFYSKEMKDTRQLLGLCGKAYQNNLHVELSRSYNLLGQFFWTKKDWKKAIDAFDAAADLQDRTGHQTYRWIAKTNLALINLELRNNPDNYNITRDINVSPEEIDVLADLSKYIKGVDTLADFVNLFGISKESEQNYLNRGQDLFY